MMIQEAVMAQEKNTVEKYSEAADIGTVRIADDVVALIAAFAAMEVEGIASMAGGLDMQTVSKGGMRKLGKTVKVEVSSSGVKADIAVDLIYGYSIPAGAKYADLDNYYTGEKLRVPLDPLLTPAQNAQKYFDRYGKLKRTAEALNTLTAQTEAEIRQLRSILVSLDLSADESDIAAIREELAQSHFIRRGTTGSKGAKKNRLPKSQPFHYMSRDGFDIYVGKNNLQNDELSFRLAGGGDLWFHANDMPGSHVILKTGGRKLEEIPDQTFLDAASLAAHYSSGREQEKVEVDYLFRRDLKKPAGARPGFVVYYTNYSILAPTDISGIRQVTD